MIGVNARNGDLLLRDFPSCPPAQNGLDRDVGTNHELGGLSSQVLCALVLFGASVSARISKFWPPRQRGGAEVLQAPPSSRC